MHAKPRSSLARREIRRVHVVDLQTRDQVGQELGNSLLRDLPNVRELAATEIREQRGDRRHGGVGDLQRGVGEQTQNKGEELPIDVQLAGEPLRHEAVLDGAEVDDGAISHSNVLHLLVELLVKVRVAHLVEEIGEDLGHVEKALQHADCEVAVVRGVLNAGQTAQKVHDVLEDIAIRGDRIHHRVDAVDVVADHFLGDLDRRNVPLQTQGITAVNRSIVFWTRYFCCSLSVIFLTYPSSVKRMNLMKSSPL